MRILRCRQWRLILPLLYALSPAVRFGLILGRPRPTRLTEPLSINVSKNAASCRCPGASTIAISLPPPSARKCTLVLNPPWLRPKASLAGSPFLRQPRADALLRWCHPHRGSPNRCAPQPRRGLSPWRICGPRFQPYASDRSDWQPYSKDRSAQANRARELLSAVSTVFHLLSSDGLCSFSRPSVSVAARAASAVPTARLIYLLGTYPISIPGIPMLFANTPKVRALVGEISEEGDVRRCSSASLSRSFRSKNGAGPGRW